MEKIIKKWWSYGVLGLLAVVYLWSAKNMYFHQDDLDWFILANRPFLQVVQAPIGDHVNYLWRLLLSFEWNTFGLNFAPYLVVSVLLHMGVIWLLYKVTYLTTKRRELSAIVATLFAINTNWTEIILWISGQTISITVFFVLLTMYAILRKKGEVVTMVMSGVTSALSIGFAIASLLVYGYDYGKRKLNKVGVGVILTILIIFGAYYFKGTDGTEIAYSFDWVVKVMQVATLMTVNTVIGRLIIPFDKYEMLRIILVVAGGMVFIWKYRSMIVELWSDKWSRFLIFQLVFYNLIVAAGRAQYGVGIMRAERYAYLGLVLVLLLAARMLRKVTIGKWIWIVPIIVVMQCVSLYRRASDYIVRPQQLKQLITEIKNGTDQSEGEKYLPHFVLNDERLKYSDLYALIKR